MSNKRNHSFSLEAEVIDEVRQKLREYNARNKSNVSLSEYVNLVLKRSLKQLAQAADGEAV